MLTLDKIYHAAFVLKDVARKTDLIEAPKLSKDCQLYLKTENLQATGSFKVRGAYYKISQLSEEESAKGVIACSAGNHAQGVALAATRRGIKSIVCMPDGAPIMKVENTKNLGAEVCLVPGTYDDAHDKAVELQEETGMTFIHPYDDEQVIAGQGTIGLEILDQLPDVDAVVVPVGGGGLISGVAFAIKSLRPEVKVYGVQAEARLEQLTEELAERLLTVKGRKVYGYLPPRVKAIVDAIVEELAKNEQVSAAYETWQTLYEQVCLDYDQRPPKRLPLSRQKEFRSVRNMVIQETLQWIAERQRYADVRRTPSMQEGPIIKKDAAEAAPKNSEVTASLASAQPKSDRAASAAPEDPGSSDAAASEGTTPPAVEDAPAFSQQSVHPDQQKASAPAGADHHAPTVGETVVRMLHHMSRIFEDNSKIDQIHRGLQIDRKRRQELQRKRLAMGHKPDDHEEQTFR